MGSRAIDTARTETVAEALTTLARAEGTAAHAYVESSVLLTGRHATRNLADAVHHLCVLHGRYPGVLDHAVGRVTDDRARKWLGEAIDAFNFERGYLTRLAVAAGPVPSTPRQAEAETMVGQQRHSLATLAQSERNGCALGAAVALVLDWHSVRRVMDAAGVRLGLAIENPALPNAAETRAVALAAATSPAVERAIRFGAQQLFAQHRGLWDLLEARQAARGDE